MKLDTVNSSNTVDMWLYSVDLECFCLKIIPKYKGLNTRTYYS